MKVLGFFTTSSMNRLTAFINKYGIIFHSLSILFWLFILSNAFQKFQSGDLPLKSKIAFGGCFLFLILSIFNLYRSLKQRKN